MKGYFPNRMYVAKVAGRILISDGYFVGEHRGDPWEGFGLPEGAWELERSRTHLYRPLWGGPDRKVPDTRRMLRSVANPRLTPVAVHRTEEIFKLPAQKDHGVAFNSARKRRIVVNGPLLKVLVEVIDGEPTNWVVGEKEESAPRLVAYDGAHWLGTLMGIREPREGWEAWQTA